MASATINLYPPTEDQSLGSGNTEDITLDDAATTTASDILKLIHRTSGTAGTGFGTAAVFQGEDASDNGAENMGAVGSRWTTATAASEASEVFIQARRAGAVLADYFAVGGVVNGVTVRTSNGTYSDPVLLIDNSVAGAGGQSAIHFNFNAGVRGGIRCDANSGMNFFAGADHNFWVGGDVGGGGTNQKLQIKSTGSVVVGAAALATTATDGFLYIPTCAGTPTGVPTAFSGRVAMIFDTTNNKFYIYDGGWLGGTTPGVWI